MSDIKTLDSEINQMILSGQAMEAFEKHYAEDIVMVENFDAPCEGKEANRKREIAFFSNIEAWHGGSVGATAIGDNVSFKGGNRVQMRQVAVRTWKDGKVVHERFYYKPAN
jgi:hypothetical protein